MDRNNQDNRDVSLQLHVCIPDNLSPAVYANHMTISRTPSEFVITFVQIPPLRDEVARAEVREKGILEVEAVANVVVSQQFLPDIVETLQRNMERTATAKEEGGD